MAQKVSINLKINIPMKKVIYYLSIFLLTTSVFISCSKDEEDEVFISISEVKVDEISFNGATISWNYDVLNANKTATKFDVYINSKLTRNDITETTVKIAELISSTKYSGKIVAIAEDGTRATKYFTFTTATAPSPSSFDVVPSAIDSKSAVINWTEVTVADNSKITYFLYVNSKLKKGELTERTYFLQDLLPTSKYVIKIVAVSDNGKQVFKETVFTTSDSPKPTNFSVSVKDITLTNAIINWTETTISDNSTITYSVYLNNKLEKEKLTEKTYSLSNLSAAKEHYVKVVAISSNGKKTSKEISFTTQDFPTPSNFTITPVAVNSESAIINWTQATITDNSVVTYSLFVNEELKAENLTLTSYALQNLLPFKKYYIKIVAKSIKGKERSNESSFKTLKAPRPSAFTVSIISSDINSKYDPKNTKIQWTPSTISNQTAITYHVVIEGRGKTVHTVNYNQNNFVFNDLHQNTAYRLRVIAKAANGTQTESNEIKFETIPYPKITHFTLTPTVTDNSATINWTKATLDGKDTSYKIKINNGDYVTTNNLSHTFTNLAPGNYTVEVIAEGVYKGATITEIRTTTFVIVQ